MTNNYSDITVILTLYKTPVKKLKKGIFWTSSHPIAGSEVSGPEYGTKNLFYNKWCILIKEKNTNRRHPEVLKKFWKKN